MVLYDSKVTLRDIQNQDHHNQSHTLQTSVVLPNGKHIGVDVAVTAADNLAETMINHFTCAALRLLGEFYLKQDRSWFLMLSFVTFLSQQGKLPPWGPQQRLRGGLCLICAETWHRPHPIEKWCGRDSVKRRLKFVMSWSIMLFVNWCSGIRLTLLATF